MLFCAAQSDRVRVEYYGYAGIGKLADECPFTPPTAAIYLTSALATDAHFPKAIPGAFFVPLSHTYSRRDRIRGTTDLWAGSPPIKDAWSPPFIVERSCEVVIL
jgi:hypothetical protein